MHQFPAFGARSIRGAEKIMELLEDPWEADALSWFPQRGEVCPSKTKMIYD